MKNCYAFLVVITMSLLTWSCQKDIEYPSAPIYNAGDQVYGWVNGFKNGDTFEASGSAISHQDYPNDFFGLEFLTYSDLGELREVIRIGELEYGLGLNPIEEDDRDYINGVPTARYTTFSSDGDVIEDSYKLESSLDNWIEVTMLDTIGGELLVSGKYYLHFIVTGDKVNPLNPDRIRFTDGEFEVKFRR